MQKEWRSKDIVVIQKENNVYLEDDGNKISLNIEELIGLYVIFREIIENFNNRKKWYILFKFNKFRRKLWKIRK